MSANGIIIAGKYRLLEYIAEGAFGEVFYGIILADSSSRN